MAMNGPLSVTKMERESAEKTFLGVNWNDLVMFKNSRTAISSMISSLASL